MTPLWSVMIPAYNCAGYLRETLASILAQDPGPDAMQIEVVDDASTRDDPAAVVEELGRWRVGFFRQPANVGHVRNFNTCLERAQGRLVHLLHGDDRVREGFYARMAAPFLEHSEIGAAFCRQIIVDGRGNWLAISPLERPASGILPDWLETLAVGQRLQAPAMVVRREVYRRLGGFDPRFSCYGEDWEMWVRIAARYPVWYEPEPLAFYRIHGESLSGLSQRSGDNGRDLRLAIEINRSHLPPEKAEDLTRQALESFALACLRRARRILASQDGDGGGVGTALAQVREAWRTSPSPLIARKCLPVLGLCARSALRGGHGR
jgi:glycosyltransferase involved in cell wall biosynthesis